MHAGTGAQETGTVLVVHPKTIRLWSNTREMTAVNARSAIDIVGLPNGHGSDVNQLVAHHFASLHVDATETHVTKRSHMQMGTIPTVVTKA
jgi:hypothetical protein